MKLKSLLLATLISCTANTFASDLPNAATYSRGIPYRGVNLAGGAFASGNASQGNFLPVLNDAPLFLYRGMNIFRIPVAWEYLGDKDGNLIPGKYLDKLTKTISDLNAKGAYVIIDIHSYMRYNPSNLMNDYNHHYLGDDVIGYGANAPSQTAYANLWKNIVKQFHCDHVMYDIMNEPHDMPNDLVIANENAAIQSIRNEETTLNIDPHWILIEGNDWTGMHSWVESGNSQLYPTTINDPKNHFMIELHQYFDSDNSGTHNTCISPSDFKSGFDHYWPQVVDWMQKNKVPVFLGEFGSPDTTNCRADITYLLDHLNGVAYTRAKGYGVIGWTVWAAGGSWGNYILSIAPGGPANSLMFNNALYQNYLTEQKPLPTTAPILATLTNSSSQTLLFSSGAWPFWLKGSASLAPGKTVNLYQPATTAKQYELTYHKGDDQQNVLGIGVSINDKGDGWGFSYGSISGLTVTSAAKCSIKPKDGDTKRCWQVESK